MIFGHDILIKDLLNLERKINFKISIYDFI